MDLNNFSMWATAVSGWLFVLISAGALAKWWFRHQIKEALAELRPNGGGSMHDRLKRVEAQIDEVHRLLISK